MHDWGDEGVDWTGISDAAEFIARRLLWARIPVKDWKEKWGTVQVYCDLGWNSLLAMTHPGHIFYYKKYPAWLAHFDIEHGDDIVNVLNRAVVPIHEWWYRQVYKTAIRKWPHLRQEILCAADWHKLLEGL